MPRRARGRGEQPPCPTAEVTEVDLALLRRGRKALGEALLTVAPEQARDGVTALLASCLGLLASFIGDDLVLILVREIWPDLPAAYEQPGRGGILDD